MAKVPFFVHMVTKPVGDDAVRRHRAAVDLQLGRGLSIVTNMGNGYGYTSIQQGAVKRLWDVKQEETEVIWAAGAQAEGEGIPEPGRLPGPGIQGSRDRQAAGQRARVQRNRHQDLQRAGVGCLRSRSRAIRSRAGRVPRQGHLPWVEVPAQARLGRQVRDRDQEVRVLQRDRQEGAARAREEVQHLGR